MTMTRLGLVRAFAVMVVLAGPGVYSWGVDARTNQVVVTARAGQADEAAGLVYEYGDAVRVEESAHEPQLAQEFPRLDGGIPYNGCSTGFNMTGPDGTPYILTAGHCGPAGTTAVASNGVTIGPVVDRPGRPPTTH
jgi:Alpha-lytic protease prodomain